MTQNQTSIPWFIQVLLAIGGWITAFFFFGGIGIFISIISEGDDPIIILTFGLLMVGGATTLRRSVETLFTSQLALALHIAGQFMLIIGLSILLDDAHMENSAPSIISTIIIVMDIFFIAIYPDSIFRFLAILAVIAAANTLLYHIQLIAGLSILSALMTASILAIWLQISIPNFSQIEHHHHILKPIGYGLIIGLAGTLAFEQTLGIEEFDYYYKNLDYPIVTSILILPMLLYFEYRIINELWKGDTAHRVMQYIGGATVIIALPTLSAPGIAAGMMLILLGYYLHNFIMQGLAYGFLVSFIAYFYYSLNMTLLTKSLIMMATGVLFIVARFALQYVKTEVTA